MSGWLWRRNWASLLWCVAGCSGNPAGGVDFGRARAEGTDAAQVLPVAAVEAGDEAPAPPELDADLGAEAVETPGPSDDADDGSMGSVAADGGMDSSAEPPSMPAASAEAAAPLPATDAAIEAIAPVDATASEAGPRVDAGGPLGMNRSLGVVFFGWFDNAPPGRTIAFP